MIETPFSNSGRGAGEFADMADNFADARAAVRLRELSVTRHRVDDVAREVGTIGRR